MRSIYYWKRHLLY